MSVMSVARRGSAAPSLSSTICAPRWDGLILLASSPNGRIEIDSNVVERAIWPIALGRKNHLFAGSDGGGEHWAVIASLIETCKMNGVDPHGGGCGRTTPLTSTLRRSSSNRQTRRPRLRQPATARWPLEPVRVMLNATDGPVMVTIRKNMAKCTFIMGAEPVNMAVLDVPVWITFFNE